MYVIDKLRREALRPLWIGREEVSVEQCRKRTCKREEESKGRGWRAAKKAAAFLYLGSLCEERVLTRPLLNAHPPQEVDPFRANC